MNDQNTSRLDDKAVIYHSQEDGCWIAHSLRTDQIGTGDSPDKALADLKRAVEQIVQLAEEEGDIAVHREAPQDIQAIKHFLANATEGEPTFKAEPWYNPHGDCIQYTAANEAAIAEWVDEVLTIYRSAVDNRPIGFQINGAAALIRKLGLAVACAADDTRPQPPSRAALPA